MCRAKSILLFLLLVLAGDRIAAQDTTAIPFYDISRVNLTYNIQKGTSVTYIHSPAPLEDVYSSLVFKNLTPKGIVPNDLVTKNAILRFNICNTADTARSAWFFPGFFCWNVQLYGVKEGHIIKLPSIAPKTTDSLSFRKITLAPHDSITILAELTFARTYLNRLRPRLIHPAYAASYLVDLRDSRNDDNLICYLFCGLLLMMIFYSLANFFQGANKDFLYYSGYAFFLGLMLFLKSLCTFRANNISFFQEEYLDFILFNTGYLFYMLFMQKYLGTRSLHPFLYKLYNTGIIILLAAIAGYTFSHYFTGNFVVENAIETFTKLVLLVMTIIFLVYSFRHWKDILLRYLFWGNLCLFAFSLFSQVAILAENISKLPGILKSSLFYYEIGLVLELLFFLVGLNHKNRRQLISQAQETERLKAENQMKEYEKELAVFKAQQQERERISADIHDELGSGMTAIRLMSEIARNKMKEDTPAEIGRISQSADEVLNKMNAIIWSMNSENDTTDNLVSYIRSYALEYFENTPIECKVSMPDHIEPKELTGDKRRNIFLCLKETLNNTLKHSGASIVKIDFRINHELEIRVADNGVGIDLQNIRQFGNGLKNIARRMESIGGRYTIEKDHGTVTTLTLSLD